jgi:hypothetical protein
VKPIEPFLTGPGMRWWPRRAARLVQAVNALLNLSVVGGHVKWSKSNVVITVPRTAAAGGAGAYRGDYDPAATYAQSDMVRVKPDNAAVTTHGATPGFYIAFLSAPTGTAPVFPEPVGAKWHRVDFSEQLPVWL